ncbi:hypothetical protein [Elizabethkingia sp. YR214]|uniref:hypothetical protein n=1 Tax=Elizabethkingia sp. YR214 TaxID=2135667 RepID=UPI0021013569|nr:hypothetical protein [Elizabethkingia sp. YR214]
MKRFGLSADYQYQGGRQSWFESNTQYDQRLSDYFDTNFGISYVAKKFDANLLLNNTLNRKLYSGYRGGQGEYAWTYNAPRNFRDYQ